MKSMCALANKTRENFQVQYFPQFPPASGKPLSGLGGEREKVNIFTDKCLLLASNHISRVVNDFSSPFALITDSLVIFINYRNACSSSSLFSLGIWVIFRIQRSKNSCVSIRNRSGDHINTAGVNKKEQ